MALVLIKEDGTGKADANSYASAADADAYWSFSPWSTWSMNTPDQKVQALVLATRLIDAMYQFSGGKAKSDQALQWPRVKCLDPDNAGTLVSGSRFVPDNSVPAAVVQATCEMAREVMALDRTAAPPGEGIDYVSTSSSQRESSDNPTTGGTSFATSSMESTKYSKSDTRQIISRVAQAMLSKYGALVGGKAGIVVPVRV